MVNVWGGIVIGIVGYLLLCWKSLLLFSFLFDSMLLFIEFGVIGGLYVVNSMLLFVLFFDLW